MRTRSSRNVTSKWSGQLPIEERQDPLVVRMIPEVILTTDSWCPWVSSHFPDEQSTFPLLHPWLKISLPGDCSRSRRYDVLASGWEVMDSGFRPRPMEANKETSKKLGQELIASIA